MKGILKKRNRYKIIIHMFFITVSLCYFLPLILVVSASFTSERYLLSDGFSLFPREFTTEAYKLAFANGKRVLRAYGVTAAYAVSYTLIMLLSAGMTGYALSRHNFAYKRWVSRIVFFTMLFNGGPISIYIINTSWYHLGDSFGIYIAGAICGGAWNILMIKSFVMGIPESLFESAKIDGAKETTVFFRIAVPLSKPVLATLGFYCMVSCWNNWTTSLVYIRNYKLQTLQYLLQEVLNNINLLKSMTDKGLSVGISGTGNILPSESLKYALCVIVSGPMLLVFPFFQKFFVKGATLGAVKA